MEERAGRAPCYVVRHSSPNGKRTAKRFPHTSAGRKAAVEHLKKYGVGAQPVATSSLSDYLDRWLERKRTTVSPKTWVGYEQIVRVWLIPNLGKARLDRLLPSHVTTYLHALPLHPQTVSHHRAVLRKALADAETDGLVSRNAAKLAQTPTVPKRERKWLDGAQLQQLFDATREQRFHAMWVLAGTTGLRSSEMLGLAWSDIDLEAGSLLVHRTLQRIGGVWRFGPPKTKQERRVWLAERTIIALREHRAFQVSDAADIDVPMPLDGLVFTTPWGLPYHGADLSKHLRRDLLAAGLPVVTVHALRHSCATYLLETGTPIEVIASILGHSTPAITSQLYTHIGEPLKKAAVGRLSEALG